jgi:nucleotide-binding universal stress UspA family protein
MFQRILVPTDFSDSSIHALRLALDLARKFGGHITLLNVGVPTLDSLPGIEPGAAAGPLFTQIAERMGVEMQHALEKLAKEEVPDVVRHDVRRRDGYPPEVISEEAKDGGYDVIVMGTHGHTGIKRVLLGSVTDRVLRLATVPVLVCR